jgi:hypothetical protein
MPQERPAAAQQTFQGKAARSTRRWRRLAAALG